MCVCALHGLPLLSTGQAVHLDVGGPHTSPGRVRDQLEEAKLLHLTLTDCVCTHIHNGDCTHKLILIGKY